MPSSIVFDQLKFQSEALNSAINRALNTLHPNCNILVCKVLLIGQSISILYSHWLFFSKLAFCQGPSWTSRRSRLGECPGLEIVRQWRDWREGGLAFRETTTKSSSLPWIFSLGLEDCLWKSWGEREKLNGRKGLSNQRQQPIQLNVTVMTLSGTYYQAHFLRQEKPKILRLVY